MAYGDAAGDKFPLPPIAWACPITKAKKTATTGRTIARIMLPLILEALQK
jgi:hypothetical protein